MDYHIIFRCCAIFLITMPFLPSLLVICMHARAHAHTHHICFKMQMMQGATYMYFLFPATNLCGLQSKWSTAFTELCTKYLLIYFCDKPNWVEFAVIQHAISINAQLHEPAVNVIEQLLRAEFLTRVHIWIHFSTAFIPVTHSVTEGRQRSRIRSFIVQTRSQEFA